MGLAIMKIVGWHLVRLAAEAEADLAGASVESIRRHPSSRRLLFILGSRRGKRYLVIGVRNPTGLFWSRRKEGIAGFADYAVTESFNRLRHARLVGCTLPQPDRLLIWRFQKLDTDKSTPRDFALVTSWVGSGNAYLTEDPDHQVLESLYPDSDAPRGQALGFPQPPDLIDWRRLTLPDYEDARAGSPAETTAAFARRSLWGIDATLAAALPIVDDHASQSPIERWREFRQMLATLRGAVDPGQPIGISDSTLVFGDNAADATEASLASALAQIDAGERDSGAADDIRRRAGELIKRELRHIEKRIRGTELLLAREAEIPRMKSEADLLGAQRHLLRRGMSKVAVTDWDTGSTIEIAVDPKKTPQENLETLYQRVRTAQRAAEHARGELPELERRRGQIEEWTAAVEDPETPPEELEEILDALGHQVPSKGKTRELPRLPYREFVVEGFSVLVGRSRRDNDDLTLKHARPNDIFLHAQSVPGSHVILRAPHRQHEFDPGLIVRVAGIAAFFSKAKHSGLVPVSYTERRFVRKPRGAPAGTVTLTQEKSVMVEPTPPPGYHEA